MKEQKTTIDLNLFEESSPFFGQSLLRDVLLPNLLGSETNEILYWAGKEIARQYPLKTIEDTTLFFERAGFGNLMLDKRDHQTIVYLLTGTSVESRIKAVENLTFNLEAGFLAEQIQQQEGHYTEAFYEVNTKKLTVTITLKKDAKDSEPIEQINEFFTLTKLNNESDLIDIPEKTSEDQPDRLDKPMPTVEETKDLQLNEKSSIFDKLPSRSSKHTKK